jgi:hypothetical protein
MAEVTGLFRNGLPYDQIKGTIMLTTTQHRILYPKKDKYHKHVTLLDLAYNLHTLSLEEPLFKSLEQNILPALKWNAIPHESMSIVAQERTRLFSMLGKFILYKVREREYCGVLHAIEPERCAPKKAVFLIIMGAARERPWRVRLEISQLADGTAECDIMADEQGMDEDFGCVLVETPH